MQKIRYISITVLLLFGTGFVSLAQYDSIVKANRVKYQQMRNKMDEYETVKSTFTVETGENVQGTAYYEENDLKIIEVIYLSETGHRQIEYYFENGNLYFALERNQPPEKAVILNIKGTKNKGTGTTASGTGEVIENRYYFYGDNLMRWYDNERKEIDLNRGSNSIVGDRLIGDAYKMKGRLRK